MKQCLICGTEFKPRGPYHKFCSKKCNQKNHKDKLYAWNNVTGDIGKDQQGAISELAASVFLMRKGYEVFRAFNPAAPCDLVALKDDQVLRVQVKTVWQREDGTFYNNRFDSDIRRYDLLIRVSRSGDLDVLDAQGEPVTL